MNRTKYHLSNGIWGIKLKKSAESLKTKLPCLNTKAASFASILIMLILLLPAVNIVQSTNSASSSMDDWPTYQHDSSHTGYSTSTAPLTNQTLWTFTTGGEVESSPIVADGLVYVGSDDGYFYALNAYNGSLVWKYNTYGPVQSSATFSDGVVYFGGFHSHSVFALNASTGALIWNSPTVSVYPNEISSTAVANGLVYVDVADSGFGGTFYALNASTGSLVWKYVPNNWLYASPAIYNGKVYLGISNEMIVALDAISGDLSWSYFVMSNGPSLGTADGTYNGYSSLTVTDGLVYIGTSRLMLQAWNASDGSLAWIGNIYGGVTYSTPAVANGVVYVSTGVGGTPNNLEYGGVTALNAKNGALLWNHTLGSITHSSPAVADGIVFVGSDETPSPLGVLDGNSIYALNASTGATIWSYTTGGEVYSSPAVAYGAVYVGSNDGKVYAFGSPQETYSSPTPTTSATPTPTTSATPTVPEFSVPGFLLVLAVAGVGMASLVHFKLKRKPIP